MLFYVRDRRNFASKKLDVVQKESMVINAMGNNTLSNFNQGLKEIVQNRPIDKRVDSVDSSDKTSQKIDNEVSLQEHDENAFQKIDSLRSSNWLSCENSQESALDDCGLRMGVIESEDLSSPGMIHMSLHQETLDHKPLRKLKRKLQKCQVTGMHLGSSILFGISLSLRKKKHKKIEQCTVKIKNLTKQHLLEGQCSPTDLRPSTSERTRMLFLGGTLHSQRKGLKCGSSLKDNSAVANNVKSSNYDLVQEGIIHEEFRDKLGENGSKESRRDSLENGFMSMLTRGLDETIVACWDGLERTLSQITESSGVETISIGYVADECSELTQEITYPHTACWSGSVLAAAVVICWSSSWCLILSGLKWAGVVAGIVVVLNHVLSAVVLQKKELFCSTSGHLAAGELWAIIGLWAGLFYLWSVLLNSAALS
ncbi:hypothetical protein LOK49_LG04G00330 [Camellia lanceoleosa]|uniref:Uncharacterized protein n=1 Tax=Camellia lanceoleosa TaxID=1840588 RepID=A0ACC0HX92_9ERIC|nr:hypothetical protein LOK49_LG04G00330 [Camellia lanceoleosa]